MARIESINFSRKFLQNVSISVYKADILKYKCSFTNMTDTHLFFHVPHFDPDKPRKIIFSYFVHLRPIPNWNTPFQTIKDYN
jgi:hypothetical protein